MTSPHAHAEPSATSRRPPSRTAGGRLTPRLADALSSRPRAGLTVLLASSLILCLTCGLATPALAAPDEEAARARVDALAEDLKALERELSGRREARDDAAEALAEVETALAATHRRLDELQAERRTLGDEIADLEERRAILEGERRAQEAALAEQLDALYRLGVAPQLKLLLNQDDPARLDRLQTYLNHLSRARQARLDELARLDTRLADNRRALTTQIDQLARVGEELETRSQTLASRLAERETLLAELEADISRGHSRQARLKQEREDAERVLGEVRERLAALKRPPPTTAIESTRGELPWPTQGRVLSGFGAGEGVDRDGLLIQAAAGSPVKAVHAGRVVFADWMRGFGNLLILDHGDGVMTLHAHLQNFTVSPGEAVNRGQPIAAVGVSGGRTTPALYFAVRRHGQPIDPATWVARR
ncbi:peptidoglycan DD-metalloendopeptidase family protein [Halomonas sp. YLGW01]|uniref:murein hydrolase activator EnvC family protein n=1 Tax=Halomonas sp. YLGW01 TaxID=2773308 RepID=UPI001F5B2D77|nr:peptidoglycan DD-metalloendopeptidase family protein [Halomonas sp. YLGW01]